MYINIDLERKYDSSKLLFSIPVHEKQDIINNLVENIFNYNPNSKIILHVNKTFTNFDPKKSEYKNLFVNSIKFNYVYGKGLLWIHINNFLEAINLGIDFDYFCLISSNEMFIKKGLIEYIKQNKNGLQIVEYNKNVNWHLFHKDILQKDEDFIQLLKYIGKGNINGNENGYINNAKIYGGQAEGNFFEKEIFKKISELYLKFMKKEINNFETEEIVPQTIFKSLGDLSFGVPFTLQNYSNNFIFTEKIIEDIRSNKITIPNSNINNTLYSPHAGLKCNNVYSIKRIDRNMNSLRKYISKMGFVLNGIHDSYMLNTNYYSYGSKFNIYSNNHFSFYYKKNMITNWILCNLEIDKGSGDYYFLDFEIKCNKKITNNFGLEINGSNTIFYNYFTKNLIKSYWNKIRIINRINEKEKKLKLKLKFIFEKFRKNLHFEIKNINSVKLNEKLLDKINIEKENIIICL